ncbi:MAG: hypothetical protein ABIP95_05820 [Pelobium sp.]
MKINEFNRLPFREQLRKVLDGKYLTSRIDKGLIINIYHVFDFLVEESYDYRRNKVIALKSYLLDKFLYHSKLYDMA